MFDLVYIDSDGVLADFSGYVMTHYGKTPGSLVGQDKKDFWKWVQYHNDTVEPFFYNLPKMHDADRLIEYCRSKFKEVKILTATGHTPIGVGQQKIDWYKKHYSDLEVILVRKSSDKAQHAVSNRILIDDRVNSITPWIDAGGIGVLHTSTDNTVEQIEQLGNI